MSLRMEDNLLALCVNMVNRFLLSSTLGQKLHPSGDVHSFWASQRTRTVLCCLMGKQWCCQRTLEGFKRHGEAIWLTIFTASATHGNTNLALEQGCYQP